jgi:hypothetical protein
MAQGKVMELFLSSGHLIATIGVHMSKVTKLQFGKTTLLGGGPDYQGEEIQKEPITTFRILSKQWEEEEVSQGNSIISNRG